ncbi:hypothetical protein Gpo141_00000278 [Globisporangium polare]
MAGGGDNNDDVVRSRIDASSARLTSLRTPASEAAAASTRRPKFVPKAAKRRPASEEQTDAKPATQQPQQASAGAREGKSPRGEFVRNDRARPARGGGLGGGRGEAGRGRGGRGRGGRGQLPTGKVTFVGTLSGGSSYSSSGTSVPRASSSKPSAAADGMGISLLDDEDGQQMHDGFHAMQVEEEWPPVVKSVMAPMSLPVARQPEPEHAGAVFHDTDGRSLLPEDALIFIQFPTTLPLANAVATLPKGKEGEDKDVDMDQGDVEPVTEKRSKLAVKPEAPLPTAAANASQQDRKNDESADESSAKTSDELLYDRSIAAAPGGFIGKLCIRKSGKTVLMIGDKQFEVAPAQTPSFCEEIYSIDTNEQHLYMLGAVERHLVVTPDFDALLA